jgi:hypothetical protein
MSMVGVSIFEGEAHHVLKSHPTFCCDFVCGSLQSIIIDKHFL